MNEPSPNASLVGRLIDRKYKLEGAIRDSGHSTVYRALHTGIQRYVEVAILRAELPIEGPDAARLVREGRAAGSVAHRNVQSVVDSGVDDIGRPFVVYEALEGTSLEEVLADNPQGLPVERSAKLMMQILEGLNAVHAGGVVHRLLAPANIRVVPVRGGGELVKLCGFDEAVFMSEIAMAEPPSRLPPKVYQAPELTRRDLSQTVDVYAAGIMLRAMLTGSPEPGGPGKLSDTARRAIDNAAATREERFPDVVLLLHAVQLLVRTSKRPAREDVPIPDDPLEADFQYMQMRRKLGHISRVTHVGETHVSLLPVLLAIEAIYKDLGDAQWSELVGMHPNVEDWLPGAGNTEINRKRGIAVDAVARMLGTADDLGGRGDLGLLVRVGDRVARRGLRRLIPSMAQGPAPDVIVDRVADLWSKLVGDAQVKEIYREPGSARLAVRGVSEPKVELCAVAAGCLRAAIEAAGGQDVEVRVPTCQGVGDRSTIFNIGWRPS